MRLLKYLLPCAVAACSYAASMHAADGFSSTTSAKDSDNKALADFVKGKSGVSIQEKGGNLMLSGDVRSKWYHFKTQSNGNNLRGHGTGTDELAPFGHNEFYVEANLIFGYKADNSWAVTQLKLENAAGTSAWSDEDAKANRANREKSLFGSATLSNIVVRKAYLGYNLYDGGTQRFDVELGRRRMYDVFDSRVMFDSYFDSMVFSYKNGIQSLMDVQVKVAPFIIDSRTNHFGVIGEVGLLNLADFGIDLKYSYTQWNKNGVNAYNHKKAEGAQFNISQFLAAYNFTADYVRVPTQVYAAYLVNHKARMHSWTNGTKANDAFYVGFKVGELKKQNDWAFDISYRWVQAQAMPEYDVRDVYRDNPSSVSIYQDAKLGYTNFKGYAFDGFYNITNNLTLEAKFGRIHQCQKKIGGKYRSWCFELDAIYAF